MRRCRIASIVFARIAWSTICSTSRCRLELFRALLQRDWFRDKLYRRYRHLIVDNVEEDTPLTHDLLRDWIPHTASALIVYDTDAGYRSFLGADARSAYELRSVCDEVVESTRIARDVPRRSIT